MPPKVTQLTLMDGAECLLWAILQDLGCPGHLGNSQLRNTNTKMK